MLMGSPPRVRGTENSVSLMARADRITPACAGNRQQDATVCTPTEDHPRVCGEQRIFAGHHAFTVGSPPRVRGTAGEGANFFHAFRITPACAGNRYKNFCYKSMNTDHPRVCGEQESVDISPSWIMGSPPRVRGTAKIIKLAKYYDGITPACAGNS